MSSSEFNKLLQTYVFTRVSDRERAEESLKNIQQMIQKGDLSRSDIQYDGSTTRITNIKGLKLRSDGSTKDSFSKYRI